MDKSKSIIVPLIMFSIPILYGGLLYWVEVNGLMDEHAIMTVVTSVSALWIYGGLFWLYLTWRWEKKHKVEKPEDINDKILSELKEIKDILKNKERQ